MNDELDNNKIDYILQACACVNLRSVSGSITQLYNKLLEPTGLKITQYYMLINIIRYPAVSISNLGEIMSLDQTTVSRNLNILKDLNYVNITTDKHDSRTKFISITDKGLKKLNDATPIWMQVQHAIESNIGREEYENFLKNVVKLQEVIESFNE